MSKPRLDQGPDYERGFIDGMQHQMQSSVDKAVNRRAQPEQEPVACDGDFPENFDASLGIPAQALRTANAIMCDVIGNGEWDVPCIAHHVLSFAKKYTTPPQPEQEPVAIVEASWNDDEGFVLVKRLVKSLPKGSCLYTTPPQRTWVGLTPEEREELMDTYDVASTDYAQAIEAKLKEKNT